MADSTRKQASPALRLLREHKKEFWSQVKRCRGDRCWAWQGELRIGGYGRFSFNAGLFSVEATAHRVAYALAYGGVPEGTILRHTCDNARCVRPGHLIPGTYAENNRDAWERGRNPGMTGKTKLSPRKEQNIRRRYAAGGITMKQLALQYRVHKNTIVKILKRGDNG